MGDLEIYFQKLILDKKTIFRRILAVCMIAAGFSHFIISEQYTELIPNFLPYPTAIVYVSGVLEILGGVGLLIPQVSFFAAWGLVLLLIAIWFGDFNMALNNNHPANIPDTWWFSAISLSFQLVLIIWAWWLSTPDKQQDILN